MCMLIGSRVASAQEADAGILRLFQGNMEIGRETFRESGRALETTIVIPLLRIRIAATVERDAAGRVLGIDERVYELPADTVVRVYSARIDGDSIRENVNGRARVRRASVDDITPSQSLTAFVRLVQRSNRQDHVYHVWLPSADSAIEFALVFHGDTARAMLGPQLILFHLGADGLVRRADLPQSYVRYDRFVGTDIPPMPGSHPPAPDYTAPANAAYTAEAVTIPVHGLQHDEYTLGCTLTKPKAGGPRFPAAMTLTGSGQQDRDENLWPLVNDYRLFRQVAERLAAAGIAVLRCDDHGYGASGGALDTLTSMLDFAADAQAQLSWLRGRPDVNGAKLAIVGHSEGGIVGPMVAAQDAHLAALVIMAGPSKTMNEILREQFLYAANRAEGLTPEQRDAARAQAVRDADDFGGNAPGYMRFARTYDPLATARRLHMPTLILQGTLDRQITQVQADSLADAVRAGGNRDVTVRKFDGLNHLFLVSPSGTGAPGEYASLHDVAVPAAVLDALAEWLRVRLR